MRSYQIAELEKLTGIKAHTIRIWEKRYGLITPDRTSTNYRRYNSDQLKKLLNIATLNGLGHKISQIATYTDKEINNLIIEANAGNKSNIICQTFLNELLAAMLKYDEKAFEKSYSSCVEQFGLFDAMTKVFYPLLNKIGFMWTSNEVNPAQEHFASYLIKKKLMAATDKLPAPHKKNKRFVLSLLPMESHDISLLFANYIIKAKGFETIYLGQDVPFENIMSAIKDSGSNFFLTFFTVSQNLKELTAEIKKNLSLHDKVTFLVSGNTAITKYLNAALHVKVVQSPHDLLNYLKFDSSEN